MREHIKLDSELDFGSLDSIDFEITPRLQWFWKTVYEKLRAQQRLALSQEKYLRKFYLEQELMEAGAQKESRSKEVFQAWLQQKALQKKLNEQAEKLKQQKEEELKIRIQHYKDEVRGKVTESWLKVKEYQKRIELEKKKREREIQEQKKKEREELNRRNYEAWVQKTKNRPRPVDQSINSLAKTKISYINPHPWKPLEENSKQKESMEEKKG